jgi:hypothetical protein
MAKGMARSMEKRSAAAIVALLILITVASVSALNLIDPSYRSVGSDQQVADHVNVPVYCGQSHYLADHHCVLACPPGFVPGNWFTVSPPASFSGGPCMTGDGRPVSIYDLAGSQVSADGGTTSYSIVSDVPLVKVILSNVVYGGYWSLRVSQLVLIDLPTLASVPAFRTEIATIGDQAATFKILRIDPSTVTGNRSTLYPLGYCCTTITISVGDDVGVPCEGLLEKVARIDFLDQKVTFSVQIVPHDGCPICLSGDTVIGSPKGLLSVKELAVGTTVWTMNRQGERVSSPIVQISKTPVPATYVMVHLILKDGRELYASPGHPTTDGRKLSQLKVGDSLDGSVVMAAQLVPYNQSYTYDLLPAGDTGFYWANGILIASTLK